MERQRYLIIPQRERLASDFVMGILYVAMFILAILGWAGFFYLGTKPLDSERSRSVAGETGREL